MTVRPERVRFMVIDVADRVAADAFVADEPLSRGPDGRSLTIERWRFGHV